MQQTLLVTLDSLRADHVGHLGYERPTTPTLDRLAAEGSTVENAFAHACSTRASFPSILTSAYALMYGGFERVSPAQTTLAEVFSEAGYETAGFHSNLYLGAEFGYDRGFDTFFDSKTDPSATAKLRQTVKGRLDADGLVYRALARAFDVAERRVGANVGSAYVDAAEITDKAADWIAGSDPDRPHFLWVHYMDPHHPYVPPAEHQRAFRTDPIPDRRAIQLRRKMIEEPAALSTTERTALLDLYDAEIRYADAEIDRLVARARDAWDDVTVMVTADHGEEFGDHGRYSHHTTFYDELIHVPLVFVDGTQTGRFEGLVGLVDVPPTLVDRAGLDIPASFHGMPIPDEGDAWDRDGILGTWRDRETGEERLAYRTTDWKYITHGDGEELYDLTADPDESENVAASHPEILARYRDTIEEHREAIAETAVDVQSVEMDEQVKARLRQLGYKE